MRTLVRFAAATMLLASSATMVSAQTVSAQNSGNNDSVDYAPRVHTVAGILPLKAEYELAVSAPTHLNKKGEEALPNGIPATLRVNVDFFPEGASKEAAQALVSLTPPSMTFYALGETHKTTVTVGASADTTPGDYKFTIQAVAYDTGLGWGISNHTLTVSVARPVVLDTTKPVVTIMSPTAGQEFAFCTDGTTVPVTISAVDVESAVTAVGFTVNDKEFPVNPFVPTNSVVAEGQFVAAGVGAYELGASAISAGGTGQSAPVGVSVKYLISWLLPSSNGKGAVPIKFAARDCQGTFVSDSSVRVEVWEAGVQKLSAVYGDGSDAVRISEDDEHYITNFKPAAGAHTYTVKVFFKNYEQASTTFVAQ